MNPPFGAFSAELNMGVQTPWGQFIFTGDTPGSMSLSEQNIPDDSYSPAYHVAISVASPCPVPAKRVVGPCKMGSMRPKSNPGIYSRFPHDVSRLHSSFFFSKIKILQ